MSQKVTIPRATRLRLPKIKDNILTKTQQEIADTCGVVRETINRDIQIWIKSGEFDEWLDGEEFLRLYVKVQQEDPKEALRQIVKLKLKRMVQKTEQKVTGKMSLEVERSKRIREIFERLNASEENSV